MQLFRAFSKIRIKSSITMMHGRSEVMQSGAGSSAPHARSVVNQPAPLWSAEMRKG